MSAEHADATELVADSVSRRVSAVVRDGSDNGFIMKCFEIDL